MSDVTLVEINDKEVQELFRRLEFDKILKKDVKSVSRKALSPVKRAVQQAFTRSVSSDPRLARLAVKQVTYKKNIGGNVSLYSSRGATQVVAGGYEPPKGGKSGITRKRQRSAKAQRFMNYGGRSRWMILMWLNNGVNRPNRGSITPMRFFDTQQTYMPQAAETLANGLANIIQEVIDSK